MLLFDVVLLPVATVSLAAFLLLVPILTLDWMRLRAHFLLSDQSSRKHEGKEICQSYWRGAGMM